MWVVFVSALLIGITMGLLGSGGSILTVPVLRYVLGHEESAFAESLAIVGMISTFAAVPFAIRRSVDWHSFVWFGLSSMAMAFVGAWISKFFLASVRMTVFAMIMLLAFNTLRKAKIKVEKSGKTTGSFGHDDHRQSRLWLVLQGAAVGIVTGFVGVGGGFMIVPALMFLVRLPIKRAMGTSLVIVASNCAVGLIEFEFGQQIDIDWTSVLWITLIGMIGSFAGQYANKRIDRKTLRKVFAIFLLAMALFVLAKELPNLI